MMTVQTIGYDKINQLRHVKFLGTYENLMEHMKKHRAIIEPKFKIVLDTLEKEIAPLGIGSWEKPNGGYFISFNALNGCAKRICQLCKEAGVVLTGAGATYPYGKDPDDSNIRIAPTFPPESELKVAADVFATAVKLASAEKASCRIIQLSQDNNTLYIKSDDLAKGSSLFCLPIAKSGIDLLKRSYRPLW